MKRIQIKIYPATFEFKINEKLPDIQYDETCYIRSKILHKMLKKFKIECYGHYYADYAVTSVIETKDGEYWNISS